MRRKKRVAPPARVVRYNLGSGPNQLPGYINIDRSLGTEAYPLKDVADGSADEVRASHILEHFPHGLSVAVLKEWARVLKVGGHLKVAVPDFEKIAAAYKDDKCDWPIEGYLLGGQTDKNDFHHSMWDKGKLTQALEAAGLVSIRPWKSEVADCAALPVSLNLQGSKPSSQAPAQAAFSWPKIGVVQSVPRLGFMDNNKCLFETCLGLPVTLRQVVGVFWGACMTQGFEQSLDDGCEFILAVDYDTVFTRQDLHDLVQLMRDHPEAAAIVPLQAGRDRETPLLTIRGADGKFVPKFEASHFAPDLVPIASGHFGLTLIRAEAVKSLPKPWFAGIKRNGRSADDDIYFWRKFEKTGRKVFLAPHVVVGHLELVCSWPGDGFRTFTQSMVEYRKSGKPPGVWQ